MFESGKLSRKPGNPEACREEFGSQKARKLWAGTIRLTENSPPFVNFPAGGTPAATPTQGLPVAEVALLLPGCFKALP